MVGRLADRTYQVIWGVLLLVLSVWIPGSRAELRAQDSAPGTLPVGRFLTDSFELGRPFRYALSFRHPISEDVLFPDSAAFAPFLVREKTFLPTRSDSQISTDSAVYTLVSFDTQPQQFLRVPLYIVGAGDCTVVYSSVDTVFFRSQLLTTRPDTLALQPATQLMPLRQELNYPVLIIVLSGISLFLSLVYALFARTINRQLALLWLRQRHLNFLRDYNGLIRTLNADSATDRAYQAVVRWRNYLERLEQQPYSTMTTPEIVARIATWQSGMNEEAVGDALKTADRMIYGGTYTDQSNEAMRLLRTVAVQAYRQRRAALLQPEKTGAELNETTPQPS